MSSSGTTIALPLPGDVDVSDMPHMPLFDSRLMKSKAWLRAKHWRGEGPGLGFVLMNLWAAAFRAVPAGSLEDDDDVLADAARCDIGYWLAIKDKALTGWQLLGGRWHHQTVSEVVWDLWLARLKKRHENAIESWRAASKRCADKGLEAPDPPGAFLSWREAAYPATALYISASASRGGDAGAKAEDVGPTLGRQDGESGQRRTDFDPKRSKGKDIPPIGPPLATGANTGQGLGKGEAARPEANGKRWYASEIARLCNEFGPMAKLMRSHLQRPGVGGDATFVHTFKGAFLDPKGPAIVMPSKRRADAVWADHSEWISQLWPQVRVRHATVDELRGTPKGARR